MRVGTNTYQDRLPFAWVILHDNQPANLHNDGLKQEKSKSNTNNQNQNSGMHMRARRTADRPLQLSNRSLQEKFEHDSSDKC